MTGWSATSPPLPQAVPDTARRLPSASLPSRKRDLPACRSPIAASLTCAPLPGNSHLVPLGKGTATYRKEGREASLNPTALPPGGRTGPHPSGAEGAGRGQGSGQEPHLGADLRIRVGDSGGRGPARPAPRPPRAPPGSVPGGRLWLPAGRHLPSAWRGPRRSPAGRESAAGDCGWGWRPVTAAGAAADQACLAATLCFCLGSGRPSPHSPRWGRGTAPSLSRGGRCSARRFLHPRQGPEATGPAGGLVVTRRGGGQSSLRRYCCRRRRPLRPTGLVGAGAVLPAGRGAASAPPAPPRRSRTRCPGGPREGGRRSRW